MRSTSNTWRLAPHVHAAAVDDDLVFLDVGADRYLCLPQVAGAARLSGDQRALDIGKPALAEDLAAAGLIYRMDRSAPAALPICLPRPARSALENSTPAPQVRDLVPALRSLCDLSLGYRRRQFADILATETRAEPRKVEAPPSEALLSAVRRLHRWTPYLPVSGKCLLQSYLALRQLRRAGHDAAWVFGVSTWPFRAHCWLQHGDMVLNDTFERVRAYQTILVV